MRRATFLLLTLSGCCLDTGGMGESTSSGSLVLGADAGCPYCTPGAGDGLCVVACPPGSLPTYSTEPGTHCNFGPACATGLSVCGGNSVTCLASDPVNCGTCGHACGAGQQCIQGICNMNCGGSTVTIETDPSNCGTCGNVCPAGQICAAGACGVACAPTPANCTGKSNLLPDGGLGCPTCPSCTFGFIPFPTCVDITSDTNNCGACGQVCGLGEICSGGECETACTSGEVCGAGVCQTTCPTGTSQCLGTNGGSAVCVDLQNDASNCGSCGNACQACIAGSCVQACSYFFDAGLPR